MKRYWPQFAGHCPCGCRHTDQWASPPVCPHCDPEAAMAVLNASEAPWRPPEPDPPTDTTEAPLGRQEGTQP